MIASLWPEGEAHRFVVCTGGEPMLQIDQPFVDALHEAGFEIAIETNGSLPVLDTIDWICVSPKADAPLVVTKGNELKVIVPQENQPMDGASRDINTRLAIDWCKRHPQWRLSMQTHKYLNIP
jgi:organic radical activating enzyme